MNPCLPFKVPMVLCRACNSIRGEFALLRVGEINTLTRAFSSSDLDLCRNVTLLVKGQPWTCGRCSTEYHRASIEALTIDALQRRMVSYQLQDLRCGKRRTMKSKNLCLHHLCAGEYRMLETRHELTRRMQVTANDAKFHGLGTRAVALEWMQGPPLLSIRLHSIPVPLLTASNAWSPVRRIRCVSLCLEVF